MEDNKYFCSSVPHIFSFIFFCYKTLHDNFTDLFPLITSKSHQYYLLELIPVFITTERKKYFWCCGRHIWIIISQRESIVLWSRKAYDLWITSIKLSYDSINGITRCITCPLLLCFNSKNTLFVLAVINLFWLFFLLSFKYFLKTFFPTMKIVKKLS